MTDNVSKFISLSRMPVILGPVLIHCHWPGLHTSLQYTCVELGWITVPLFFFISGYLLFQKYDGTLTCYKKKLKQRLWSLLIPYLLWNLLGYMMFAYIDKTIAPNHLVQSFFALPEMAGGPADHPLWFLRNIILYTLAAPLIWLFVKRRSFGYLLALSAGLWLLGLQPLQHGIVIGALFFIGGGILL